MTEKEIDAIMNAVDTDQNGAINFTEFVAATLNKKILEDSAKI